MLKTLTEASAVAGFENKVRSIILKEVSPFADSVKTDNLGNIIAFKKGRDSQKSVVLSCHMDEAGFIISDITDEGYLHFRPIGKIPPEAVISKRVKINDIFGVISFKAIHLTTKQEREKPFKFKDLMIDIGADGRDDAKKYVRVGDLGVLTSEYREFGNDFIKAKALDSRTGCAIITDLLKNEYNANIYAVFASCGKVENRGLTVAAKAIKADFAINIDAFDCGESAKLGKGVVIPTVFSNGIPTRGALNMLKEVSEKNNIELQFCPTPDRRGGSLEFNCEAADIVIPLKHEDSPANIISKNDYAYCANLIDALLRERL